MITGKTPFISTVSLLSRPVPTATAGVVSAATGPEADIKPISGTDKVHLSEPGLSLVPENGDEHDAVRQERIQALKQAIEEKRYHVNSRQIAEKLLQEASDLMKTLTGYPLDPMEEQKATDESADQDQTSPDTPAFADTYPKPAAKRS